MNHILKTQKFNKLFKTLIFGVLVVFGASCSKTTENIGNGLLSDSDHIGVAFTDTLHIACHSMRIDSMPTQGASSALLGSMMDPVMGLTNAGFITQLHLSSTNQYFGDDPIIDSVVLQLYINGYYGDTATWQTVHVYELAEALVDSADYYQFSDVAVEPNDLANGYQFLPHPYTTGAVVGDDTLTQSVLRIPLSVSLGERFASADSTVFSSSEAFKTYFNGLKVCCESVASGGSIISFNPTSNTMTQLQVYYRETPDANPMRYYFYITSEDVYFNQSLHDYTLGSPEFVQQVLDGQTNLGQQQLYLQTMGGVRVVLSFTDLMEWAERLEEEGSHLIVNEAKLIIPALVDAIDTAIFTPPTSLALLNIKEDGTTTLLPDYMEGTNYYGGNYSSSTNSVTFRISEYLQSLILGSQTSQGLYLSIVGASYNAKRWVIAGPEANQDDVLRCEIKYSIVKE